jgi:uncharacterized protein YjeT (DUF2065 family)
MEQQNNLLGLAGFILIVSGLLLIVAQAVWHDAFERLSNDLHWDTIVVGFGGIVIGAILLLGESIGTTRISK